MDQFITCYPFALSIGSVPYYLYHDITRTLFLIVFNVSYILKLIMYVGKPHFLLEASTTS
jgi:hypothetical protein